MELYGYTIHDNGTATLDLMTKVASGKGDVGSSWKTIETIKTGPRKEIEKECEKRNRELVNS